MQTSPHLDWGYLLIEIARILAPGGIGSIATWALMRKRNEAEVHTADANAALSYAEAQKQYSEIISEAYDRIDQLYKVGESQREQLRITSMDRDKQTIEIELLEDELKWVKSVMVAAGVRLSDYDYLRRKREDG